MVLSEVKDDFIEQALPEDDAFSEEDWVNGFSWIHIAISSTGCNYDDAEWLEYEAM